MRELNFSDFNKIVQQLPAQYDNYEKSALEFLGEMLEKDAKEIIGHIQEGWADLAESTKKDKIRKGFVFNMDYNPLLRTGEMRDSISHSITKNTLFVGSTSEIMVYQEMGTIHIPPRPVLGLAMYRNRPAIEVVLSDMLMFWITRGVPVFRRIHG